MNHPQRHFVEGMCLELRVLAIELNCVRVYAPGGFICQFLGNAWTF